MSHDLETHDGRTFFASAREHAWHRLGQVLPGAMTAEEALEAAHLARWNVRKAPLTVLTEDGVQEVPDNFATIRTNPVTGRAEYLGVVGARWTPVQNEEHAAFLNALVDESGAVFETAGSMDGGRRTFMSLRLPDGITVDTPQGKDRTDLYAVALNSHDGSSAFQVLVTPVRVVCKNTQNAALRDHVGMFSVRHTAGASGAIAQAREALRLTWDYAAAFEEEVRRMVEAPMNHDQARVVLRQVFKVEDASTDRSRRHWDEHVNGALTFLSSPANAGIGGTRYGVYNALTEYLDHGWRVRGADDQELARAQRAVRGDVRALKSDAFRLLQTSR